MPSKSKLSEMMKGIYSIPKATKDDLQVCLNGLWGGTSTVEDTKQCEKDAMSKVADDFAKKWTK